MATQGSGFGPGIQVINDPYRSGGGFGRGITSGLQAILGEMVNKRQQAPGFEAMGVPSDVANKISNLSPHLQAMFLNQFFSSQASSGQPELEQQLSGMQAPEGYEQQQFEPQQSIGQIAQQIPSLPNTGMTTAQQAASPFMGALSPETLKALQPYMQGQQVPQQRQEAMQFAKPEQRKEVNEILKNIPRTAEFKQILQNPQQASPNARKGFEYQMKPTQQKTFQQLLATPKPSRADMLRANGMATALDEKQQKRIDAETKEFYDTTTHAIRDAKSNDMRLDRMAVLNEKGHLGFPFINALAGFSIHGFAPFSFIKAGTHIDTQEFDKISKDFVKGAKSFFGSRITEKEVAMFLDTVPSLTQSTGGRRAVIRNLKVFNEAAKIRNDAMNEIIEMNGGERPKNLETLVEKKAGPKLDQLHRSFQKGIIPASMQKAEVEGRQAREQEIETRKKEEPILFRLFGPKKGDYTF